MKKPALPAAILLLGFVGLGLPGCPIYDHEESGCYETSDCQYGYVCDQYDGSCILEDVSSCRSPNDCGVNETCDRFGTCSVGDCSFASVGCVSGYECKLQRGRWECVTERAGSGGSPGAEADASSGGTASPSGEGGTSSVSDGGASEGPSGAGGA